MKESQLNIETLRQFVEALPADGLSTVRSAALRRLEKAHLPTTRDENWRYTDLSTAVDIGNRFLERKPVEHGKRPRSELVEAACDNVAANWLVITDGRVDLSRFNPTDGVIAERFAETEGPVSATDPLSSLNTALLQDGLRIRITANIEEPLGVLIVDGSNEGAHMSQARVDIDVAPGCSAELVEYQVSSGDGEHYCNSVTSVNVGESASVALVRVQDRSRQHVNTHQVSIDLGRRSELTMATYELGAAVARSDIDVNVSSAKSRATILGLYLAGEGQHIDNHVTVEHRVGPAESSQDFRGILDRTGRAVWNGKAVVHKGADGTDANQANHNLLLSDRAEIDAKPELEIYADDVKCSHGTTVGQLDEAALFYLRSRGLDPDHATQVLIQAFARDHIEHAPVAAVIPRVLKIVEARMAEFAVEAGR